MLNKPTQMALYTGVFLWAAAPHVSAGLLYPAMKPPLVAWFHEGRPLATVVAGSFESGARAPASILNRWLERITGATLPVQRQSRADPTGKGPSVWVGGKAAWNRLQLDPGTLKLGPEGYVLRTVGNDLVITGETELGTVFGVAAFLDHYVGCRWFWEGDDGLAYPTDRNLRVGRIDEISRPAFRVRWVGSNPDWCAFNGLNVRIQRPGEFCIQWFVHTWLRLVPPTEYWQPHPEFYAEIGGVRKDPTGPRTQENLCTTNPAVVQAAARTIDRRVAENSDIRMVSVDPMDTQQFCQCPQCRHLYNAEAPYERRASRLVFDFTRRVAEQVGRRHPNLFIKTIAYQTYLAPPDTPDFRLPDNVMVQFCRFMCHNHALNDPTCPENRYFNRHLIEWTRAVRHIMMYEYYYKVSWCGLPWPIVHTLRRDIPYLHHLGITGVATQWCANHAANGIDFYVAAKLLWNPALDVNALLDDFYAKAYGRAAGAMKRFHERLEDAVESSNLHIADQRPYRQMYAFLTPALLAGLDADLHEAEQAVRDRRAAARVRLMRANLTYCQALREYLAAIHDTLADAPHSRWLAALPEPVMEQVKQRAHPMAKRLETLLAAPENRRAVPGRNGYIDLLLSPRRVAENWNYPGDRPTTEVVLDKVAWLKKHAAAPVLRPHASSAALWIYGNDLDWIKTTGPEHIVHVETRDGRRVRIGAVGRPDRAGDGRNLCFVIPRVSLANVADSALRIVIENPAGGPYASKIFALYLMPDEPVDEDEAGKLIETAPETVRAKALGFAEYGYAGCPSNEGTPLKVTLRIPRAE